MDHGIAHKDMQSAHNQRCTHQSESLALHAYGQAGPLALATTRATLWAVNPNIKVILPLLFAHVGVPLTIVDSAPALLDAAARASPNDLLVIDCVTASDAWERCIAVLPHTTVLLLICHPYEEFVNDLQRLARGRVCWLPPSYTGLLLFDKLRSLVAVPSIASTNESETRISSLTTREQAVQRLVSAGRSNREIAALLGITERTVKNHVANGKHKLGISTRAQFATAHQLVKMR